MNKAHKTCYAQISKYYEAGSTVVDRTVHIIDGLD